MILIAIGANLPGPGGASPLETCKKAAGLLRMISGLTFVALSGWYRTQALPAGDQPDYCNGVIRLEGATDPAALLATCLELEAQFLRVREQVNGPRTLDLDLLDVNGIVRDSPDPILPHPRAHLRAFVLLPLRDVAPAWVHPGLAQSIGSLIAALPAQDIHPL